MSGVESGQDLIFKSQISNREYLTNASVGFNIQLKNLDEISKSFFDHDQSIF